MTATATPEPTRTGVAARAVNASKVYGSGEAEVRALDGISVDFARGQFTAIMGPSGSGKSTLMHCLAGLDRLTSGQVFLGDLDITALSEKQLTLVRRDKIGFVFQAFNLIPTLTALENVTLPEALAGRKPDQAWLDRVIDTVGLRDRLRHRPSELSGGQQQRVALARALAPEPEVICLDEPFTALDASVRERIREDVCRILRSSGTTAILVTHEQAEALSMADRVAVVRGGRVAQVAEPRYLYRNPIDLDVARFIGGIVELRGTVSSSNRVSTAIGEIGVVEGQLQPEAVGILVLRPEQLSFDRQASDVHATAVVLDVTYYGHDSIVKASLVSGELVEARIQGSSSLQRGELVSVLVSGSACFFEEGPTTAFPFSDTDLGG